LHSEFNPLPKGKIELDVLPRYFAPELQVKWALDTCGNDLS